MTAAIRTTRAAGCTQCAGRDAEILEVVSGSRLDNDRVADRLARELGNGAHTHAALNTDMHVVRSLTRENAS
ncbi:hypothetical protein JK359_33440 [Streptomyces actinomycinicus]|uniref:Uncharacterized protein n=1 Tax=Streptomyces actinomycinicus TaxID=1695166 RepID=A0A937EPQ2_9ACTN|nr:hypothetical protein [Streptomyces actinomycinicus]MBL1086811.1 hypothetical protein [Streptomyces actinomycinicus]